MSARPPRIAAWLLARALQGDPAGPAILGDLQEDFSMSSRTRGARAARRWYRREAIRLALSRRWQRTADAGFRQRRQGRRTVAAVAQDACYAFRTLRRSPGYALFTAAVIGLGVGAATSVYGVLEPLILAPLPFDQPHELVWISHPAEPGDNSLSAVTQRSANLYDFRLRARSFSGLTGYNAFFDHTAYTLTGVGEPERLVGADVAHDFLDVLGVRPLHGRGFTAEEGRPSGPAAVILTHGYWQRRFAGDPGIVGTTLMLGDRPRTVVGVLPPTFDFSSAFSPSVHVEILVPFPVIADGDPGFQGNTLFIIGRLRPGATPSAAQTELDAILAALLQARPDRWGAGAVVTPLQENLVGPFRPALLLLASAAATLLIIVCVNVSNMILARSPGRARELAVRQALGAPRARLVRQLLLETLAIAVAGATFGCAIAWGATRLVVASAGQRIPLMAAVGIDGSVLLFATTVALLTGLLVGIAPALQVAAGGEAAVLRRGGHASSSHRGARRLREALVIVEVTLACVLLVAGGLLVRSFRAVLDVDLGFEADNAIAWQLDPRIDFETQRARSDFYAALTARVADLPGVEEVGLIDALPLGRNRSWPYRVVGRPITQEPEGYVFPHVVDPGYMSALRIELVEGRNISAADDADAPPVVMLNESGARHVFDGERALGRRLRLFGDSEWEVVGVVRDVRHLSPEMDPGIQVYLPVAQMPSFHTLDLVVRSGLGVPQAADAVAAALRELDPAMPTNDFWTVESTVNRALSTRRFTLSVLTAFAAASLLLAGLGIYGVLAHAVAERRQEIGIRMALGASSAQVLWSVLARTLALTSIGVLAGAVLALATTRLLSSLLFEVTTTDPGAFGAMALVLLAVATLAGLVPARRAARTGAGTLKEA